MQEVFEKIKERLEKERKEITKWDSDKHYIYIEGADWMGAKSIEIVDQVAKEFAADVNVGSNIVCKLKEFLKEKKKYNSEQADIWRDCADKDAYFREMKDLYMDRANTFGRVLTEIKALEEEDKDGWIPFEVREADEEDKETYDGVEFVLCGKLPEEDEEILVTYKNGYVDIDTFLREGYECYLDSGCDFVTEAVAWMPKPKGYKV